MNKWGAKAMILEPESLIEEIRADSEQLAERYREFFEGRIGSLVG